MQKKYCTFIAIVFKTRLSLIPATPLPIIEEKICHHLNASPQDPCVVTAISKYILTALGGGAFWRYDLVRSWGGAHIMSLVVAFCLFVCLFGIGSPSVSPSWPQTCSSAMGVYHRGWLISVFLRRGQETGSDIFHSNRAKMATTALGGPLFLHNFWP